MNRTLIVIGMAVSFSAGWWTNGHRLDARYQTLIAQHQTASAEAISSLLEREHHLQKTIQEIHEDATQKQQALAADVATVDAINNRVQQQLADISKRYSESTAATAECRNAATAARVSSKLLSESQSLAGIYASRADAATIANESCIAAYETLREEKWIK